MAAISGWVYLALGVFIEAVTFSSRWLNEGQSNLGIFTYVGLLFITIGVFKLLIRFIMSGKSIKESREEHMGRRKELEGRRQRLERRYEHQRKEDERRAEENRRILLERRRQAIEQVRQDTLAGLKVCPRCGLKNASYETVCERCKTAL